MTLSLAALTNETFRFAESENVTLSLAALTKETFRFAESENVTLSLAVTTAVTLDDGSGGGKAGVILIANAPDAERMRLGIAITGRSPSRVLSTLERESFCPNFLCR